MSQKIELITAILWTMLAGIGGAARYIAQVIKEEKEVSVRVFLLTGMAHCFISGFSGLMGALVVSTMTTNTAWHFVAAGIFGYLGIQGVELIVFSVRRKYLAPIK